MKKNILKYFILALLFSSFTTFVNAIPAFPTNTIPCISTATELEPENTCKACVKGIFTGITSTRLASVITKTKPFLAAIKAICTKKITFLIILETI